MCCCAFSNHFSERHNSVAVKLYPNSQRQAMKAEFGKANLLRFPSLPRLLGWTRMADGFGIVLEVYGTTLRERLASDALFEDKLRWARQVAAALRFLHGRVYPITHGDVYVSNVLLSNENAILCDFDRASMDGAHAPEFARFSWFPHFPQHFHLEDRKRLDWFQFGLFLLSLVSDGKWDWREKRELITTKVTRSDFAHLTGLSERNYDACPFFAVAFEDVVLNVSDDAVVAGMRALNALWAIGGSTTPEDSDE